MEFASRQPERVSDLVKEPARVSTPVVVSDARSMDFTDCRTFDREVVRAERQHKRLREPLITVKKNAIYIQRNTCYQYTKNGNIGSDTYKLCRVIPWRTSSLSGNTLHATHRPSLRNILSLAKHNSLKNKRYRFGHKGVTMLRSE